MILVTGATGFLGKHVVDKLVERYSDIACFVRRSSRLDDLRNYDVEVRYGDLEDYNSFVNALDGIDIIVNLASLGFGHASTIVGACEQCHVKRGIFISTTAIFTTLEPKTKKIRLEAERLIAISSIKYTILRPTMIYGTERDRNLSRLITYLEKYPIILIFGNGEYLQQPVYVDDVAAAVVLALESDQTINRSYNIAGKSPQTYNEIIDITCAALGTEVMKIRLPVSAILPLVRMYGQITEKPKITVEQVLRLNEDKTFDIQEAKSDFGYDPIAFHKGIRKEVESMFGLRG